VTTASLSLPAGFRSRPPTLADAPALTALLSAVGIDSIGSADTTQEEVEVDLAGPRRDAERDGLLVEDAAGQVVAWGAWLDEADERGSVDVYVHPGLTDDVASAVAARIIDHALGRGVELARDRGLATVECDAGNYLGERIATDYERAGLVFDRLYWRMAIDLGSAVPPPQPPPGVVIRRLRPDEDDEFRIAHRMRNEAMSEHHGHVDLPYDDYRATWLASPAYDPTAWWLAEVGDEPAGFLLGDDKRRDENAGFVRTLGVRREFRGRGIARALLLTAFAEYAARGRSQVYLGVDSQNETGATALYESVGMRAVVVYQTWSATLTVAGTSATSSRNASTSA
jgi:mycothiol synthase